MIARKQLDHSVKGKAAGKPAEDFTYHLKKDEKVFYGRKLVIVDKNYVYMLIVGQANEKPDEKQVKKFYGSFHIAK